MKRVMILVLALVLSVSVLGLTALAEDAVTVYVTIANGDVKLAQQPVEVTDADDDGVLTVNDALALAHAYYDGENGYESAMGEYGLSLQKLWGVANGSSYGYYVNDQSAWSLLDLVKDGDYVNAFVYTDLTAWSDTYCYFDQHAATINAGESVTLTLSAASFDADWNPVTVPVAGAVITVNGQKTDFVTDQNGKVTIVSKPDDQAGAYVISAVSDTQVLVPPVFVGTIIAADKPAQQPARDTDAEQPAETPATDDASDAADSTNPQTGEAGALAVAAGLMGAAFVGMLAGRKRNEN